MKIFKKELLKLYSRLKSGENFMFLKAADGEEMIMNNEAVNNGEFNFIPGEHEFYRQKLIESTQFKHKDYILGVNCQCCQGEKAKRMIDRAGQDEDHLTFCNVFVNANYQEYIRLFLPEYAKRKVHLVANRAAQVQNLPFEVEKFYPVGNTAFVNDYPLAQELRQLKGKLILFAAGPFGNVAGYEIFKENQENTIIDVGSTLNPWLNSEGFGRDYYCNPDSVFAQRTCIWND